MRSRIYLISILFFSLSANVFSQEEETLFSEASRGDQSEKFVELTQELDFDRTKEVWRLKQNEVDEVSIDDESFEEYSTPWTGMNFNGSIANFIAYALILILIGVVVFLIFSNVQVEKKIDDQDINMLDIEDIEEVDAMDGFKKAITVSDYRSAIRMQFIKVLQMLQEGNHIHWRPEKTNRDYSRELSGSKFISSFRELSSIYELVWYGNTSIDKDIFEKLNPSFDRFINSGG